MLADPRGGGKANKISCACLYVAIVRFAVSASPIHHSALNRVLELDKGWP